MMHITYNLLLIGLITTHCSARCCRCGILGDECVPNCADNIGQCDCPAACLNNKLGGCNTGYVCASDGDDGHTITITTIHSTGSATRTETSYTGTATVYTSTETITEETTGWFRVTKPQTTITRSKTPGALILREVDVLESRTSNKGHAVVDRHVRRTATITQTSIDTSNNCNHEGVSPCTVTEYGISTRQAVLTVSLQSTSHELSQSTTLLYTTTTVLYESTDTGYDTTITVYKSGTGTKSSTTTATGTTGTSHASRTSVPLVTATSGSSAGGAKHFLVDFLMLGALRLLV